MDQSVVPAERRRGRRRRAEDADLFQLLVDRVAGYAIYLLTPTGHVSSWNTGAERLKGYTADEIIGQHFERFYTEEAREAGWPRRLLDIAQREGRVEDQGWSVRKDGSRFWADVVITALFDQSGALRGFAKVTRDLTERRTVEELLRQREQRFTTLVDSIKDYAIFMLSPEGTVLTWNQGAERLKGYARWEIIGQSFERFYTDEARAAGRPRYLLDIAIREGRVEDNGWRVRKDGSRFWADVVITALRDESGELIGFAKVTRDLTERRQAEEDRAARMAAEGAAERFERLQVATAALAAASRPESAAEVLTDVASRAIGAAAGFVTLPSSDGAALEMVSVYGKLPSALEGRKQLTPEEAGLLTEGWMVIPLVIGTRPIGLLSLKLDQPRILNPDERGFVLALAEVGAQALDRARLYAAEQAARTEAQEAVRTRDEFLAAAAHDLKTPLATTKGIAQLLQSRIQRMQIPDGQRLTDGLVRIDHSVERMTALIDELLDLARLQMGRPLDLERESLDLRDLVQQVLADHQPNAPRHTLRVIAPDEGLVGEWDPVRLRRVLDNLVSNAIKYSPAGGEVTVRVERVVTQDGPVAVVGVTDHGVGIPSADLPHVFERFRRGGNVTFIHGTGIGLGIVQSIVQQHGGSIDVDSVEGQGTTLTVRLPFE